MKTGDTLPEIAEARDDFEDWIAAGLALPASDVEVVAVHRDEPLPGPAAISGVVVTGSAAMVSDRADWSERAAEWLGKAARDGLPILAICYGHQLLAQGLGGRVGKNPNGREIGTVDVSLDAVGDALLGMLPVRAALHTSHLESVLELPPDVVWLGASELDPHHAFRFGSVAWGVQFHPEFDADVVRRYLRARQDILREEGFDPDALLAAARDTPYGRALLGRFAAIVVEHASDAA